MASLRNDVSKSTVEDKMTIWIKMGGGVGQIRFFIQCRQFLELSQVGGWKCKWVGQI